MKVTTRTKALKPKSLSFISIGPLDAGKAKSIKTYSLQSKLFRTEFHMLSLKSIYLRTRFIEIPDLCETPKEDVYRKSYCSVVCQYKIVQFCSYIFLINLILSLINFILNFTLTWHSLFQLYEFFKYARLDLI